MPRTRKTSAKTKELKGLATEAIISEAASGESIPPSGTGTAGAQTSAPSAPDAAKTREETAANANDTAVVVAKDEASGAADETPIDTAKPVAKKRGRKPAAKTTRSTRAKGTKAAAKKTTKRTVKKNTAETPTAGTKKKPHGEPIFALDIGTRSIIGIVAEKLDNEQMRILATVRREHKTRAMLDGQIHDVPQVADLIREVKRELEKTTGPLKSASVAAAGRALYTMTAEASVEINGVITDEQQRALDFSGVQAAQAKLASSKDIEDPGRYYCVGYSTIQYTLDDIPLKSLVGQRGKIARATVIATFLPRQVIDSMQSALRDVGLEMHALTLEPIAAINVLIPPTMRHLNLVLVDIGAGTSDVAITKNGSIIAYGMVPLAGDEITEAISQRYLLDFNVAEDVKRNASAGRESKFTDILGTEYDLGPSDVIGPIMPNIQNLADSIARQVLELNGD